MESITAEDHKTVGQKIVGAPAEVGHVIVEKTETLGHDVKKGTVEGVTAVVDTTKTVAGDIAKAGKEMGHDVKSAVTPTPVTPRAAPSSDTVVA